MQQIQKPVCLDSRLLTIFLSILREYYIAMTKRNKKTLSTLLLKPFSHDLHLSSLLKHAAPESLFKGGC